MSRTRFEISPISERFKSQLPFVHCWVELCYKPITGSWTQEPPNVDPAYQPFVSGIKFFVQENLAGFDQGVTIRIQAQFSRTFSKESHEDDFYDSLSAAISSLRVSDCPWAVVPPHEHFTLHAYLGREKKSEPAPPITTLTEANEHADAVNVKIVQLRQEVRNELQAQVNFMLTPHFAEYPLAEKQRYGDRVAQLLSDVGYRVKCPGCHQPGMISVDTPGNSVKGLLQIHHGAGPPHTIKAQHRKRPLRLVPPSADKRRGRGRPRSNPTPR